MNSLSAEQHKNQDQELRKSLRKEIITKRGQMPQELRQEKSAAICNALFEELQAYVLQQGLDFSCCTVGVYSAFPEEVQLDSFIRRVYQQGANIAFPCMIKDSWGVEGSCQQTMEMRRVSQEQYLENSVEFLLHPLRSYFHASEDIAAYPYTEATNLTMLVCPLVGFDSKGNRLGYGGGNYDRYLTQIADKTLVLGVAFTEQEINEVPTGNHDIPIKVLSR